MSAATPVPRTIHTGRSKTLALIVALAALGAIVLVGTFASQNTTSREPRAVAPTSASVLRFLTPAERQQVTAIAALSPAVLRAAFGTDPPVPGLTPAERQQVTAIAALSPAVLRAAFGTDPPVPGLTPAERQRVTAIAALSPAVLRAAFGTDPPVPGLSAGQRRFVLGLAAMTQAQLAAAYGPGH